MVKYLWNIYTNKNKNYITEYRYEKSIMLSLWSFIISFANFAKFNNSLELSELNNWHILKVFGRIL